MADQIRAIDNSRMIKKIVLLSDELKLKLKENIGIVLDFYIYCKNKLNIQYL